MVMASTTTQRWIITSIYFITYATFDGIWRDEREYLGEWENSQKNISTSCGKRDEKKNISKRGYQDVLRLMSRNVWKFIVKAFELLKDKKIWESIFRKYY